ncbi:MAG: TatD family hydrolase [Bacilli bacterium]|nr:TatD family hydrolase [Bacilli bacterium]
MKYLDSHCHINDDVLYPIRDELISRAREAGVGYLLVIGWDVESSKKAVEIAHEYENVYAAVGIHPENLDGINEDSLKQIEELAHDDKVVAIGEIGLDYHWFHEKEHHELQKVWFIKQIELANKLNLPISIHAREATGDLLEILKHHPVNRSGVLHCYSGSPESLKEFAKLGFYFGFDGPITYKNAVEPKESVKVCPMDKILTETDSPYLTPVPFRGKQNEPAYIPHILAQMASLKEVGEDEMAEQVRKNFEKLFSVEPK